MLRLKTMKKECWNMNENKIKNWLKSNVKNHQNNGEVNMTTLAEDCIEHFKISKENEERIFELASEHFSG